MSIYTWSKRGWLRIIVSFQGPSKKDELVKKMYRTPDEVEKSYKDKLSRKCEGNERRDSGVRFRSVGSGRLGEKKVLKDYIYEPGK